MTGRGPTGLALKETPFSDTRCAQSPDKRQFQTMAEAQAQADYDNKKYNTNHVPYACPSCGLFHVTSKALYGDVVRVNADGLVVTRAMTTRAAKRVHTIANASPGRVDMSEILAMEKPIEPMNRAAREKLFTEYVADKPLFYMTDLAPILQTSQQNAGTIAKNMGWRPIPGGMGQPTRWIPKDADPLDTDEAYQAVKKFLSTRTVTTVKAVAEATKLNAAVARSRMVQCGWGQDGKLVTWRPLGDKITVHVPEPKTRKKPSAKARASRVPAEVHARRKKLKAYLKTHPSPTTDELLTVMKISSRHVLRDDMTALGWWIRKGRNATWQQGERPLHLVEDLPEETETREEPPVTPPVTAAIEEPEPDDQTPDVGEPEPPAPVAAAAAPAPAPVQSEWNDMPATDQLQGRSVAQLLEEAALFGLEVRIQYRKKPDA